MITLNRSIFQKTLLSVLINGTAYISAATINSNRFFEQITDSNSNLPNVIIILADDLGYGDLGGYYGGLAKTPNLNLLAKEGMLFTDFHSNGPMCSPTRASILTGRYPQRLGIEGALPTDWRDKGIGSEENKNEITMADYFRKSGYATGIFGKWHLGKHPSANPIHFGFDEFRGLMCGSGDYFTKMDRNGYKDWWHNDCLSFQEGYATDVITDNSVNYIETHKDKPFFLYVAYNAIHFPWQTAEDYNLENIREGKDFTSNIPGPQSKLGPHSPEQIPTVVIKMIEELDNGVGRIIAAIRERGVDRKTLIFFTSDNGGYLNYHGSSWPKVGSNGPLKGQKGQVVEGGHRVPAIAWWPGKINAHSVCHETVMSFDLLPTCLDILGVQIPKQDSPNSIDGESLLPLLLKNKIMKTRPLFWRMANQRAVRQGDWKLIFRDKNNMPELYNLRKDIGEVNNLASKNSKKVLNLLSELEAWEKDVDKSYSEKSRIP